VNYSLNNMALSRHVSQRLRLLSQKLIFAWIAENSRDGIFSKLVINAGCDNIPKSHTKKRRSVGYVLLFLQRR